MSKRADTLAKMRAKAIHNGESNFRTLHKSNIAAVLDKDYFDGKEDGAARECATGEFWFVAPPALGRPTKIELMTRGIESEGSESNLLSSSVT